MADLQYTLTLTSAIENSIGYGDCVYYDVQYTSGSTYNYVTSGSPAFLYINGGIANTASVQIPSASYNYLAFKLTPTCTPCNGTSVIYVVTGSAPTVPNTASVSWSLSEYSASGVYINTDLSIFINGTGSVLATTSSIGNFTMTASQAVTFSGLNSQPVTFPWPTGSTLYVTASKDGTIFFTGSTVYSGSIVSSSFIAVSGSTYTISVSSSYVSGSAPPPPAPTYNFYNVDKYNCFPCSLNDTGLVAVTTSSISLTNGRYYNIGDGYVYYVNYSTGDTGPGIDLSDGASSTNCSTACSI